MSDTFLRYLLILQELPMAPRRTDCAALASRLEQAGLGVTRRTLQRDLEKLSRVLSIGCSDDTKPYGWFWREGSSFPLSRIASALEHRQTPGRVPRNEAVLGLLDQWRELEDGCFEAGLAPFVAVYLRNAVAAHTGLELSEVIVPAPPEHTRASRHVDFVLSTADQQTALFVRLCTRPPAERPSQAELGRRVAVALGAPRPRRRVLFLEPSAEPGKDVIGFRDLARAVERDGDVESRCFARYLRQWTEEIGPAESQVAGADVIPFAARARRT